MGTTIPEVAQALRTVLTTRADEAEPVSCNANPNSPEQALWKR